MFKKTEQVGTRADTGSIAPLAVPGRRKEPMPIGPSMHLKGAIVGNEDVVVHGHVEGRIDIGDGLLLIARDGQADADARARVITVEGRITGDLHAREQIIVRRTGSVEGNISAPRIALDFGCAFTGGIDTNVAADADPVQHDDKIADFKSAIAGTGKGKPATGQS